MRLLQPDQLVTMLAEATGRKLSADGLMAYEIALSDVSLESLNRAALNLLRSSKFMPTPAEIREAAGAVTGQIAAKDRPTLAWEAVRRAISRVGAYDSVEFDDVIIHAAIRSMGGWAALCDSTSEEMVWREKDFLRTYGALMNLPLGSEQTERLSGISERENGRVIPVRVVRVGCLTTETSGEQRFIEQQKPARITGPTVAAEHLVKRLECDDRKPLVHVPRRSVDEQLKLISAIGSRKS